jgi:hypothetical protein
MFPLYYEALIDNPEFQISYNRFADRKYSNCAHALNNAEDETIAEIESFFRQKGLDPCVYVDPRSPSSLLDILNYREYTECEYELELWYHKLLDRDRPIDVFKHLKIDPRRIELSIIDPSGDEMDFFMKIDAECNGIPIGLANFFSRNARSPKSLGEDRHYFVLGRMDGVPAMTGAVSVHGDLAFFSEAAVLPRYRRRGLYSTIVMYSMEFCRGLGGFHVLVNCDRDAFSNHTCLKTGFELLFQRRLFGRTRE